MPVATNTAGSAIPADAASCSGAGSLARALRKVLEKIVNGAGEPDAARGIHNARKAIKEYRALLRLVDTDAATTLRREAAAVARALAPARDRQTCLDALGTLRANDLIEEDDRVAVASALSTDAAISSAEGSAVAELQDFAARARAQHDETIDHQCEHADIKREMRKAYEKAAKLPRWEDPDSIHELRKRVVILRYQTSFLARIARGFGRNRAKRLQRLRDVLGWHQDLETLKNRCQCPPLPHSVAAAMETAVIEGQKRARHEARKMHNKLFARRPKAFVRRVAHRLRAQTPDA